LISPRENIGSLREIPQNNLASHYKNNSYALLENTSILWKSSAKRQGIFSEYEEYKHEYPYGKVSFKAENEVNRDIIKKTYEAIRYRINGGLRGEIYQPIGAWQIHYHAVNKIQEIIEEIEYQSGEESKINSWVFYAGEMKKIAVSISVDVKTRDKAICFITKNWINPLHNSQLPIIIEALNDAEKHLKKLGYKKVAKVLFSEELEAKGRETLDLATYNNIIFYSIPYIKPARLDEQVKKDTGIDISKHYPAKNNWVKPIRDLLKQFLWKLLLRRLFKKGQKNAEGYRDNSKKSVEMRLLKYSKLQIDNLSSYLKRRLKWRDSVSETKIEPYAPSEILSYPQERETGKPQIKIKIPEKPMKVRFSVSKKKSKRKWLREWAKRYVYPQFYRRVETKANPQKHIVINFETLKLLDEEKALNDSIYALINYSSNDKLRMKERDKLLKFHSKMLWKLQTYN
jgi:hypothetical protein